MNILFITDLYPVILEKEQSTPKTLLNFVKHWENNGHNVTVLKPNFILNSILRNKRIYKTGWYENIFNVNYLSPFLFDVKRKIPNIFYEVIIAHMPSGIIFSNKLNGKTICAVHNSDIEVLTNPLYSIYFKKQMEIAYNNALGIACRSQILRKNFLSFYPQYADKTFLCESGINFKPILRKFKSYKNIVTCANLIKRKNIDKLILAINELPHLNLKIIGDGPELEKSKKIAKSNIHFLGRKTNAEALSIMKKSDIFILPSTKETFGQVYLEAMGCGCITIGTINDGVDGIIKNNKNGFLVESNVDEIKSILIKITNMPKSHCNKILRNCYNTVKTYDNSICADNYLNNVIDLLCK
ncbi:glycosyltransferase family 4 protein [bacterium]|nr:glycosyltransferase family 4 protein [bacterium]